MATINAVIIRRSQDENTVALVEATVDPEMIQDTNDLFGAMCRAVTRAVLRGHPEKNLCDINGGDINIGDLAAEGISKELEGELLIEGIYNLDIDCRVGDATSWDYDDNLFNEAYADGDE